MKRTDAAKHWRTGIAAAAILALGIRSFAADPAQPPAAPAPPAAQPQVQSPSSIAMPVGMLMEHNGGSLLRAEISYPLPAPTGGKEGDPRSSAPPGSIASVSLFAVQDQKPKSFRKHDLVTIIAKEQSNFSDNGDTTLTKSQDFDAQLNSFIALRPSNMQLHSIIGGGSNFPEIKTTNSRDYKGQGQVTRSDTFSDRVTGEVVDVKPNGTLVLQAIKQMKTDEEEQRMILTGICRVDDITADNTVLTTQLFDMELTQTHNGAITDTTKRGIVPRLLDTFSPF